MPKAADRVRFGIARECSVRSHKLSVNSMRNRSRRKITLFARRLQRLPRTIQFAGGSRQPLHAIDTSVADAAHPNKDESRWLVEVRGQTGRGSIGMGGKLGYEGLRVTLPAEWPPYGTISAHAPSELEIVAIKPFALMPPNGVRLTFCTLLGQVQNVSLTPFVPTKYKT